MLSDMQDAYGHGVWDYAHGRGGSEIVERDDGFVSYSPGPAIYLAEFPDWAKLEQDGIAYSKGRVLDVGCCAGRVALHLQNLGHEATGIDVSPLAIQLSQERGLRDARVASVTQLGRDLGTFDSIVMYGNNLGLLGSASRGKWILRRLRGITSPGAVIIGGGTDPYGTDDPDHLAYHARNRARGRLSGQLRIRIRYRRYCTPWSDYLLPSVEELRQIVEGTGWTIDQALTRDGSGRYVAILQRVD